MESGVTDDITVETNTPQAASVPVVSAPPPSHIEDIDLDAADPGDEDPALDTKPVDDASDAGKKLAAKKGSLQARIDAITKEKYDTQRERDEARQQADRLDRELQSMRAPKAPEKAEQRYTRAKPSEDAIGTQYESYGDYVEDLTDWKVEQRDAQRQEHEQRASIQQRHEQYAETFAGRIAKAEETDPAFWSKMSPAVVNLRPSSALAPGESPTAMNAIADVIFTSDYSTDLMAHFSQHDRDFQRLSTLPPNMLYRELGRLEARFHRPEAAQSGPAPATPVSQAPAPIKPVGRAASSGDPLELSDDLDVDDYIRRANARDKKQARR